VGHSVQNDLDAIGGSTMTWPSDRLCDTADLYKRTNGKRAKLEDVFKTVIGSFFVPMKKLLRLISCFSW